MPSQAMQRIRVLLVFVTLAFVAAGCSSHDTERLAFDRLLSSNRIDRIEVVGEIAGSGDLQTNVLTGERIALLLRRLHATNRIPDPIRHKSYISGYIFFYERDVRLGFLDYFPREQVLSYQGYDFRLRETNVIRSIFQ